MTLLIAFAASGCEGGCNGGSLSGSGGFSGIKRDGGGASGAGGAAGWAAGGTGNLGGFMTTGVGGATGGPTGDSCAGAVPIHCPAALCCNGVRDTCVVQPATARCAQVTVTELCDGADVGAETCRTQRFGSGTLTCAASCYELDVSKCSECEPASAELLRCGPAPIVAATTVVAAIAATDTEVALVWNDAVAAPSSRLGFARLSPSLDLVTSTAIADPTLLGPSTLAVAPLPSGWLIAGYGDPNVFAIELDAAGREVARAMLEMVPTNRLLAAPVLAARPGGLPLLVWMSDRAVRGVVLGGASRQAAAPADLGPPTTFLNLLDAAWIGDAFYVSMNVETAANPNQLRLLRITADGRLDTTIDALPQQQTWNATLVRGADDLRILFEGAVMMGDQGTWSVSWRRLTATGAPATAAVPLTSLTEYALSARGLAFESETVILSNALTNAIAAAEISHIDADGRALRPPFAIAHGDVFSYRPADVVRRGPDVIALWTNTGVPKLARVTP